MGQNPPADLPDAWAVASRAVARDLDCRRYGRPISFANVGFEEADLKINSLGELAEILVRGIHM